MGKYLKWTFYILVGFALMLIIGFKILQFQTKKYSPEEVVNYNGGGNELSVFYNRPFMKDRKIFGGLVPFGEVWRTGANEATTFSSEKTITFGGKKLPAGHYTLWTIPGPEEWKIILNNKQYSWGVNNDGLPSRQPSADVLEVEVPVQTTPEETEQFTIVFEGQGRKPELVLNWEKTKVEVPISW
ncbi:MAG: DUF2911 domain-containing protein [Saprospiraceae bacterium]|nr:DUF2911 domain-containing protein [Lewinella sp.]